MFFFCLSRLSQLTLLPKEIIRNSEPVQVSHLLGFYIKRLIETVESYIQFTAAVILNNKTKGNTAELGSIHKLQKLTPKICVRFKMLMATENRFQGF